MKRIAIFVSATLAACMVVASMQSATKPGNDDASPIFGGTIPAGYRQWELIAPSHSVGRYSRSVQAPELAKKAEDLDLIRRFYREAGDRLPTC